VDFHLSLLHCKLGTNIQIDEISMVMDLIRIPVNQANWLTLK